MPLDRIIEHPDVDGRGIVDAVSLEVWEALGWTVAGPASDEPGSTLTADEWAEANTPTAEAPTDAPPEANPTKESE